MADSNKSAFLDAIADLADDLIPGSEVKSFVFLWDEPLGFVFDVRDEDRAQVARRMRELADAVEAGS